MRYSFMPNRRFRSALAGALVAAATPVSADLFISEYIEGSSYNKALEIYNDTGGSVDLSAYEVAIYFNGNTTASLSINLQGFLDDGEVYVLAHSSASADILSVADQANGSGWFNGDDTVVLTYGGNPIDVIGQIGVDPGSQWSNGDVMTANRTLRRKSHVTEGDANGSDAFDPAQEWEVFPQDSFDNLGIYSANRDPVVTGGCGASATKIHVIQGQSAHTPVSGTTHSIEGVVVGNFQGSDKLNGFFVQEESSDQDRDPLTSEGIFVYHSSKGIDVAEGDVVRVTGTASEHYDMTQISADDIEICASDVGFTAVELEFPVNARGDLEQFEGMAVVVPETLTVTETYNLGRYGELILSAGGRLFTPTQLANPGTDAQTVAEQQSLRRILLDDGSGQQNPEVIPYPAPQLSTYNTVRAGDTVTELQGVLHYSFSEYRIQPTAEPIFVPENIRTSEPEFAISGSFRVASFNVLNYFNGDGMGGGFPTSRGADTAEEFERQRQKIIAALLAMDADVVGLIEIENDGYGPHSAIQDLANGLNDAGMDYAVVDPGVEQIGTDEIAVGFIYKTATVEPVNAAAILDSSFDARFIDTKNRPVLAQTFREKASGGAVTLAVAHLKSKGSDCNALGDPDINDGQGNCNLTRKSAAQAMTEWLASDPTQSGEADRLIIGDLNSYAKEDPIAAIESAGYVNLLEDKLDAYAYSYVFKGYAGYLDHALANGHLYSQVTGVTEWHINADEPRVLDYNEEYKTPEQLVSLYGPEPYRASDHDPLIVQLDLESPASAAAPKSSNADSEFTALDLKLLLHNLGSPTHSSNAVFDLNQDGRVNVADALDWFKGFIRSQK